MRIRTLSGLLLLSGTLLASAQSQPLPTAARSLTLQQCIDLALSRNLDLRIEHLATEISGYRLAGAYGAYDPVLSFSARHDHISQPGDFDVDKVNPRFPYDGVIDRGGSDLGGRLPFGLSYDFKAEAGEKSAITDFNSVPDSAQNFYFGVRQTNNYFAETGVTLRQHLLRDFWIDQDRLSILINRRNLKISQEALRFQLMTTVLAVELGYYDLIAAGERVHVQEMALTLAQQFLAETRRRVEVGDLPPLDAERAHAQLQNTITALAAAREIWEAQQNAFKSLLTDNFREWVDTELRLTDPPLAIPPEINRSESFQRALKFRPDLAEARLAIEKADVTVQFRKNQLFPNLDLVGRYGSFSIQAGSPAAVNEAIQFNDPDYFYGAVMSIPLTRVSERNQYRASKAAREMAQLQLKKAEEAVLVQIADWVNRVRSRYSQISSTRSARIYTEAALAAEEKKLANGLSTSFFVLELQQELTATRTAESQALADYNKALAQLAFAEATILDRRHVTLEVK